MNKQKTIFAIGSIALDTIYTKNDCRKQILGGSASYFGLAASYFRDVQILGVVGSDFPQKYWDLYNTHNINVDNVEIKDGKTFQWGGKYSNDYDSRETLFTELGVFDNYSPIINDTLHDSQFIFLGNIHPDMQMDVIKKSNDEQKIILDTMNLWIDISLDRLKQVIAKTNIFLLNDEEAFLLTKKNKIESAAIALSELGPETIIIKKGSLGSYIYSKTNNLECNIPAFPIQKVIDTTGAGDSFAGGFVGSLNKNNIVDSVVAGSAIASFTVSEFGVDGLVNIKKEQINERIEHIKYLMKD
tara:strand:- start:966 stop:1865 length:900 start_codon:yes stop_codon:yes gene_type:complete